jgi:hypothetical protein
MGSLRKGKFLIEFSQNFNGEGAGRISLGICIISFIVSGVMVKKVSPDEYTMALWPAR